MGGKKREKIFSRNTRLSRIINDGKNRLKKLRKHVYYENTNIVTKKWGGKTRENFFPETHVYR